ncbi:MAG: nicotinamide riboside transporter PnuC [Bacteroidia bacterium]|nr:nicotinamide riboside transporter PnuC [Bacteroidia bacterium]
MIISDWISNNWIEVFGAITGIIYVFLEIRQNIWLWPVGIITSAVYIIVFFTSKFYADMSLQVYYLTVSCLGWYWWTRRKKGRVGEWENGGKEVQISDKQIDKWPEATKLPSLEGLGVGCEETKRRKDEETERLSVTRLKLKTGIILAVIFVILYFLLWFVLSRLTDSPVPEWDSFITSLSIIATWMLARKIYEHWFLWIGVNTASSVIFMTRGLYPTVILYLVYLIMSFVGLKAWKRSL